MPIINQIVKGSGGSAPAHYIEKTVDANGKLKNYNNLINFSGVTDMGNYVCYGQYYQVTFPANTNINLSSLTEISDISACQNMFQNARGLTSVDLSSLTVVSGSSACNGMLQSCTDLTSINLSSLTTVNGSNGCYSLLSGCTGLTSIDLSYLTTVSATSGICRMMSGCTGLTSVTFSSLTTLTGTNACLYMFASCTNLTTVSFPALTSTSFGSSINQFNNMLSGVTGCTIHFPSNVQAKVETLTGYPNFSGTNTVVLFDLPATNTLTGADTVEYTRNPKYDTATALAWKVGAYGTTNFTPAYYTSGTIDPVVSDTIYSDAACTTAVTTISSIA